MKILITGGAGYIGSVLTPILLEMGHKVTVLDSFPRGTTELAACAQYESFNPVRGDTRDQRILNDLVPKADVIIPLAALVGAPLCKEDKIGAKTLNQDAVVAIAKLATRQQILLYPTTNSGYGVGGNGLCTEETPINPISLYGVTKMAAEAAVLDAGGLSFRLATVFGMSPRMRLDLLVNDFTWRAVTDRAVIIFEGHFKRNYVHVRDVVKAFSHGIDNYESMRERPYNLGLSSANLSKIELCEKIRQHVPAFVFIEAPIGEDPDKRNYIVSNARLESTGWTPEWDLDRGIQELVRGYRTIRNSRYANV